MQYIKVSYLFIVLRVKSTREICPVWVRDIPPLVFSLPHIPTIYSIF